MTKQDNIKAIAELLEPSNSFSFEEVSKKVNAINCLIYGHHETDQKQIDETIENQVNQDLEEEPDFAYLRAERE